MYRSAHTTMAYGQLSYSMLTISIVGGVQMTPLFYGIYFIFYEIREAWMRMIFEDSFWILIQSSSREM